MLLSSLPAIRESVAADAAESSHGDVEQVLGDAARPSYRGTLRHGKAQSSPHLAASAPSITFTVLGDVLQGHGQPQEPSYTVGQWLPPLCL